MKLTREEISVCTKVIRSWMRQGRGGLTLPFICAFVLWHNGYEVTLENCKEIAEDVLNFLKEIPASSWVCTTIDELVFGLHPQTEYQTHTKERTVSQYKWEGFNKQTGKYEYKWTNELSPLDLILFEGAKMA